MKPKVTVLMPVYNGESYLRQAMDSVLSQTFTDFEFLIINDGSIDGTQAVIDSYSDSRIKCRRQLNQGVAKSLNNGLALATGTYIWRHDADDVCLPEQLQTQLDFLEQHPTFALVSTQIAFMSDNGKIAHGFKQPKDDYFQERSFIKVERSQFNPYSPITHATVLVKKDVFEVIGIYRTEFKTSEDIDLWLRIIEKFDAAVLHYCSYFVRLNSSSATQIYKSTNNFYKDLAFQFADERIETGFDLLQRGGLMPRPKMAMPKIIDAETIGTKFRSDLLSFQYKVMLDARDYKNTFKIIKLAVRDGWKLSTTWKGILFPLLHYRIIKAGSRIKKLIK